MLRLRLALCKRMALTAAVKFPLCKACGKVRVATPISKLCKAGFSEKCAAAGALSSGNPKRGRSKRRAGALSSGNVLSLLQLVFFLPDFVGKGSAGSHFLCIFPKMRQKYSQKLPKYFKNCPK